MKLEYKYVSGPYVFAERCVRSLDVLAVEGHRGTNQEGSPTPAYHLFLIALSDAKVYSNSRHIIPCQSQASSLTPSPSQTRNYPRIHHYNDLLSTNSRASKDSDLRNR